MKNYRKRTENPEHFILHIATNDLNSKRSPELIAKSIVDAACSLKNESHNLCVSSLVIRNDKFKAKVTEANRNLK